MKKLAIGIGILLLVTGCCGRLSPFTDGCGTYGCGCGCGCCKVNLNKKEKNV